MIMDIHQIREQFPILKRKVNGFPLVYFDNAATTQKPRMVVDGMVDFYYNHYANIHRGVHTLSVEASEMVDSARKKVAKFIGADNDNEVIFVRNATEGLNLAMYTIGEELVTSGDNCVVSVMEHHSNLVPWQMLCKKRSAGLRVIEIDESGRLILNGKIKKGDGCDMGGLFDLIDNKTKILALSMVSNVTGVVNPITRIIDKVREEHPGVVIVLDASQAVGHMTVDTGKIGADIIVFSGHKMYGPTGVGVLWGDKKLLNRMKPFLYGGDMISEVKLSGTTFADLPNKFEAGTPAIAEIVGLGYAVDFLGQYGMNIVEQTEMAMFGYLWNKMNELGDKGIVRLIGPKDLESRVALLSFVVEGVHAHDVATYLDSKGIAVRSGQHCAAPLVRSFGELATVRISLSFANTTDEIDYCVEQIMNAYTYFVK